MADNNQDKKSNHEAEPESPPVQSEDTLEKQVREEKRVEKRGFGTFEGVFVPTLLTILGVIMYLRAGWVVGNAGLVGAWLIILVSFGVTFFTGLSLSSIVTNIRVGAGGAFSIIAHALGLEVGGSIGLPLYLSQTLAVALYIFGFRTGWLWLFPSHPALFVDLGVFATLFVVAYVSAGFAFRIQFVVLAVIVASLISVVAAVFGEGLTEPIEWWGTFRGGPQSPEGGVSFWGVFAVFFPAATGIMAGVNMSGELRNPRRAIPVGTLSAIGVSLGVYLWLAYWLARVADPVALRSSYTALIDNAAWPRLVLAGLLGATFSSGLASMVGAPRILHALGEHEIVPGSGWFSKLGSNKEPRNALLATAVIVFAALMLRELNAIAPLITMFFLITYAMINVVVLLEQGLGLVSFRPLIRVPLFVPAVGGIGSFVVMFIVNPAFSVVAALIVLGMYWFLVRRELKAPFGDVRSGLFVAVAEWSAKRVARLGTPSERVWRSNVLVPIERIAEIRGLYRLVWNIAYKRGSVKLLGLADMGEGDELAEQLPRLEESLRNDGVFTSSTVVEAGTFGENLMASLEAMSGTVFRPNVLLVRIPKTKTRKEELATVIQRATEKRVGVLVLAEHEAAGLGLEGSINVWVDEMSPEWELKMELGDFDLALLISYKLATNWDGDLTICVNARKEDEVKKAESFLSDLRSAARMPAAEMFVGQGTLRAAVSQAPAADLNVFPMHGEPDYDKLRKLVETAGSSCLFALDSGVESAVA
ncbi:MAG: Na-K-Cl cotransporter [Candidatus Eisenbacteria bacterium]|nr:Na-K-Cl cotransporter [Candidatus Eisenbacteria bacterium]